MSVNVEKLLDSLPATAQVLEHGYGWRSKLRAQIFREWRRLPLHKRLYWTLLGKRPV